MNKTQLVDAMAQDAGISKVYAKKSLDAFISVAARTLKNGEKITLSGFGSFVVSEAPARIGRNFKTGGTVEIPAKSVIKFRPAIEPK